MFKTFTSMCGKALSNRLMVENGFLTDRDKKFLTGEKEYTGDNAKQLRYQTRRAIRERTRAAYRDFALLYEVLDENERNKIFDIDVEGQVPPRHHGLYSDLVDTIAFLYLSLKGDVDSQVVTEREFAPHFDSILEAAIKSGEKRRYPRPVLVEVEPPDVDVRTNIDSGTQEGAIDKIAARDYDELTEEEMFTLLFRFGELHGDESYERLRDRVEERREKMNIREREAWDLREMFADLDDE